MQYLWLEKDELKYKMKIKIKKAFQAKNNNCKGS